MTGKQPPAKQALVRKFMPENKLAKTLEDPNGLLFGHALQKASANLEKVRDQHMGALDAKLDALAETADKAEASGDAEEAAKLYRLAREILTDAGMFGVKPISRAAHSLCELMAAGVRHRAFWAGVRVHVNAIGALRRPSTWPGGAPNVDDVLAGLEKISRLPL